MNNLKPYPNTVFKFQAPSLASLKALKYGELYFASNDELNDPYDTRLPYIFFKAPEKMARLIIDFMESDNQVRSILSPLVKRVDINKFANFISNSDLLFHELIELIDSKDFENLVQSEFAKAQTIESIGLSEIFRKHLKKHIQIRLGNMPYSVSFSKKCDDPVMWSHYADQHRGFCICYSIEGQKMKSKSDFTSRFLQKEYLLKEVNYDKAFTTADAFYRFSEHFMGENVLQEKIEGHHKEVEKSFLTKFESWKYEEEIRILDFDTLRSQVIGDNILKWDSNDRIYYYDLEQLTGIIFGSRMSNNTKNEIRSIIRDIRQKMNNGTQALPIFVFYESKEKFPDFTMNISAVDGIDSCNRYFDFSEIERVEKEYLKLKEFEKRILDNKK